MNKVEEFIREFNNRSMPIFGGFTATPIINNNNVVIAVEVSKVYIDRALRERVSVIDIENTQLSHLEMAQIVMRRMSDVFYERNGKPHL